MIIETAMQVMKDTDGHNKPFLEFIDALTSRVGKFDAYVQDEQAKRDDDTIAAYCKAKGLSADNLTAEERHDIIEDEVKAEHDFNYGGDMYKTDKEEHGTW